MWRACATRVASWIAAIAHPSAIRENKSSTTAKKSHPIARPNAGRVCVPFGIRTLSAEVALEQVGSHLCAFLAFRGNGAMTWTLREKSLFSHQTSYPFPSTMKTLCTKFRMNTRAAIHAAIGLESRLHFLGKLGIFSAVLTGSTFAPSIVSTDRNLQHTTHGRNRILVPMRSHELVFHCWPREKMPMAFFSMSRSCFTASNSLLRRRTSSFWNSISEDFTFPQIWGKINKHREKKYTGPRVS
jgi:hypothetical protein